MTGPVVPQMLPLGMIRPCTMYRYAVDWVRPTLVNDRLVVLPTNVNAVLEPLARSTS